MATDETRQPPQRSGAGYPKVTPLYLSAAALAAARQQLERALGIKEAAYGPDHPDVARAVTNLGLVLRDLGD